MRRMAGHAFEDPYRRQCNRCVIISVSGGARPTNAVCFERFQCGTGQAQAFGGQGGVTRDKTTGGVSFGRSSQLKFYCSSTLPFHVLINYAHIQGTQPT